MNSNSETCSVCNKNKSNSYRLVSGKLRYSKTCTSCRRKKLGRPNCGSRYKYRSLLDKKICAECGFIPVNLCQLDIDHIDGNRLNNNMENLQVLCSNCHRLKSFISKDGFYQRGIN